MRFTEDERLLLTEFLSSEVKKPLYKYFDEALRQQQLQLTKLRVDHGRDEVMHAVARAEGAAEMIVRLKADLNKLTT